MNRDIFMRPNRMVSKYGETEKQDDPLGARTFEFKPPVFPQQNGAFGVNIKEKGLHRYEHGRSPVQKPDGSLASLQGPETDYASQVATRVPASTRRRVSGK